MTSQGFVVQRFYRIQCKPPCLLSPGLAQHVFCSKPCIYFLLLLICNRFWYIKKTNRTLCHKMFKSKLVNVNARSLMFAQIVKNAACLMTKTQYNSKNNLAPEFKWAFFEPIWSKFRFQDPKIKTGRIRNPRQNSQLIHDLLCFQIRETARLTAKKHNLCTF